MTSNFNTTLQIANQLFNVRIQQISAQQTYVLRQRVLRPHQSTKECVFDGDEANLTFHLGAFIDDEIVSILSLYRESNPCWTEQKQWRLRGMAVKPDLQSRGIGKIMITTALQKLKQLNAQRLWLNARENALLFYQNLGMVSEGDAFEIEQIGQHWLMTITL